jgi:hypothetical protein
LHPCRCCIWPREPEWHIGKPPLVRCCRGSDPHCLDQWCDAALLECGDADAVVLSRVLSRLVDVEETGGAFRQSALLEAWHADPAARRLINALSRDERRCYAPTTRACPRLV